MAWILPYVYSLLAFLGTLIYIRTVGGLARRLVTKERAATWDSLRASLAFSAPTIACGLLLLALRSWAGLTWISQTAIEVSLFADALYALFTLYRARKITKLRRTPGAFPQVIKLKPGGHWPGGDMNNFILFRDWMQRLSLPSGFGFLSLAIRSGGSVFPVTPGDFRRRLGGDIRYVDSVEDVDDELGLGQDELVSVPHIRVADKETLGRSGRLILEKLGVTLDVPAEAGEGGGDGGGSVTAPYEYDVSKFFKEMVGVSGKCHAVNRALNSALPDDLWQASCDLCRNPPHVIALTWKSFHFREDLRLRLKMLFQAVELVQTLAGAAVLCTLRATGELDSLRARADAPFHKTSKQPFAPPGSFAEWNRALAWVLGAAESQEVAPFRRALCTPREDIADLHEKLRPFREILGHPLAVEPGSHHALKGLEVIGILRNRTVGHGAVGWKLNMRPQVYLSALHQYFLAVVRDLVRLDLGVYACVFGDELEVLGLDQGLAPMPPVGDDSLAVVSPGGDGDDVPAVALHPYLRFHAGRLLFLNRLTGSGAQYVNYASANITEPSFITLEAESDDFV